MRGESEKDNILARRRREEKGHAKLTLATHSLILYWYPSHSISTTTCTKKETP